MMIDPLLIFTSFIAGALTILAPCVLPLLPVIIGGSAGSENKWRPFILTTSLAISIILFTLILKATTTLINVPQAFWTSLSGGIILVFGIIMVFPQIWEFISEKLHLLQRSQKNLNKAGQHADTTGGAILMGAALGPVFSSCSPTYFVILATVLPVSFSSGIFYLIIYGFGLALLLGLIGFFGQRLVHKLGWAANPRGWFKKILGILLIVVGLAVITGYEKKIEIAILDAGFGVTTFEEGLLDKLNERMDDITVTAEETDISGLPKLFEAPELTGLENWINSDPIESMGELRGKVVLIDFWTYSCINCIRTLPYLQSWHEKYQDDGLVIIGVHAPEFQFEKKFENVQKAVKDFSLTYAVVQDNDFKLWRAYANRYWPAKYLIDQEGIVRYVHFGEGEYKESEEAIVSLLQKEMEVAEVSAQSVDFSQIKTPETYIGEKRRTNMVWPDAKLKNNQWLLYGQWESDEEKVTCLAAGCGIKLLFTASKANLVMGGKGSGTVKLDGEPATSENSGKDAPGGQLLLDEERLYELADFKGEYTIHLIEITFDEPGAELFAWTFG